MEIKLDSKLMKTLNGVILLIISIVLMAMKVDKLGDNHWLPGLFLLFGACALGAAWYLDGKKDKQSAAIACIYAFFAIVLFANKYVVLSVHLFALWAMIEGALAASASLKLKEENANLWFAPACLGALAFLLGFVACFAMGEDFWKHLLFGDAKLILVGIAMLFAALGHICPFCLQFMPKVEIKK